jgi:hypothetical protein
MADRYQWEAHQWRLPSARIRLCVCDECNSGAGFACGLQGVWCDVRAAWRQPSAHGTENLRRRFLDQTLRGKQRSTCSPSWYRPSSSRRFPACEGRHPNSPRLRTRLRAACARNHVAAHFSVARSLGLRHQLAQITFEITPFAGGDWSPEQTTQRGLILPTHIILTE